MSFARAIEHVSISSIINELIRICLAQLNCSVLSTRRYLPKVETPNRYISNRPEIALGRINAPFRLAGELDMRAASVMRITSACGPKGPWMRLSGLEKEATAAPSAESEPVRKEAGAYVNRIISGSVILPSKRHSSSALADRASIAIKNFLFEFSTSITFEIRRMRQVRC